MIRTAEYFEKLDNKMVVCRLCPAECRLTEGKVGICGCRYNRKGELVTDNYGELVTIAVDPIEKKPLYHFYPTRHILSTGPNGCNFSCVHCQNWAISQKKVKTITLPPERLVQSAHQHQSIGIAFTYTEPMIWFEYIMDVAPLLKKDGLKVVLVTNGYISPQPLERLLDYVDAMNVDLKGIRPEFYKRICKGKLEPLLNNIRTIAQSKVHLEITNLIIPGKNDSPRDISDLVNFVASLSDAIPIHFSAYHPDYKLDIPPTPIQTMNRAKEIAQKQLKYVYLGNIIAGDGSDTFCPQCGQLLIRRTGYETTIKGLSGAECNNCKYDTGIIQ